MSTLQGTSIKSRVIGTELIKWKDLKFIQQETFKEWINSADAKLLQSILKYNFIDPYKVWKEGSTIWCLDGFHRYADLIKVEESGISVPELLPATFIDCENIKEAAELVLVYSSIYAKITQKGLYDFLESYELDFASIKSAIQLPEFSVRMFDQHFDQFQLEDDAPEELKTGNIIVKDGDVFSLNDHRIICADSTDVNAFKTLIGEKKVQIVFTSPPYNMNAGLYDEYSDNLHAEKYLQLHKSVIQNALRYLDGYLFYNISYNKNSRSDFIDILFHLKNLTGTTFLELIVWNKKTALPVTSTEMLTRTYEQIAVICSDNVMVDMEIFALAHNGNKPIFFNKRIGKTMSNYWEIPVSSSKVQFEDHKACFPLELPARAIQLTTKKNEIVFDPFLGKGTTLIAADQLERVCFGIEMSPAYIQSIIFRYLKHCRQIGKPVKFSHVNGILSLSDFDSLKQTKIN